MAIRPGWAKLALGLLSATACRTQPLEDATATVRSATADLAIVAPSEPDLAVVDLARSDLAVVDLQRVDLAPPAPPPLAAQLALGFSYSCAVMTDRTVRCWGADWFGTLGNGMHGDQRVPTPVVGLTDVAELGSGVYHVCARRSDGTVYCWGYNEGNLGGGTNDNQYTPVRVLGITDAIQLAVGDFFNCVLRVDHTVSCWGEVEQDTSVNVAQPYSVAGVSVAAEVRLGWYHGCVRSDDGAVDCWGKNYNGQVGVGQPDWQQPKQPVAHVLDGVRALFPGGNATLAQMRDGTVRGWGSNTYGQLGDGTQIDRWEPVSLPLWANMDRLVLGSYDACGIRNGELFCTGNDDPPGDGGVQTTPSAMVGLAGVSSVGLGLYHACARTHDDEIYCWGQNDHGQLGDRTTVDHTQPVRVGW